MALSHAVAAKQQVSVFSPLDFAPKAWFDASDAASVTLDASAVTQWNDKSGNGYHLSQATGANQPTYTTAGLNGLNVITFDGTNDTLQGSVPADWTFLHDGTVHIVVMVARHTAGGVGTWYSNTFGNNTKPGQALYRTSNTVINHSILTGVSAAAVSQLSAGGAVSTTPHVMSLLVDPSNGTAASRSSIYVNAGSVIATNTLTNAPGTGAQTRNFTVGGLWDGVTMQYFLNGYFAEIVIVSGANATNANRLTLHEYMRVKWAVY